MPHMDLYPAFFANWKQKFNDDAPVLLAVSGGVDSMVLATLFQKSGISFAIGHVNYKLRGDESDADEALVIAWCKENNITFHTISFQTKTIAADWKKGIQEAARKLRYDWLEALRKEHNYHHIATAHHAADNAETLLINLCKRTGIAGLHGIPERNGSVIRPLLFALKGAINSYAETHKVPFREDASNATDAYLRNQVRHHLLPAVEAIFPGGTAQISSTALRIADAELLYQNAIETERKGLLEQRGNDHYIPVKKLLKRPAMNTILYELLLPFGFSSAQAKEALALLDEGSGRQMLSATHRLIRDRDFLILTEQQDAATDMIFINSFPVNIATANGAFSFTEEKTGNLEDDKMLAQIDAGNISLPLILRRWRIGDYFYPLGMGMKKKKLSRFFIDQKLSIADKERIWVLESNKRIVWVAGLRLDERFKICAATTQVLKVTLTS